MTKARLVKRSEVQGQEKPRRQPQTGALSHSVESVRQWINQRQQRRASDAREAFALLFAEPQKA